MSKLPTKSKGPIRVSAMRGQNRANSSTPSTVDRSVQPQLQSQFLPQRTPSLRLLRFPAVRERTGLSRSTIWRLEQRSAFPRHRRISANAVAWVEEEVMRWICSKVGEVAGSRVLEPAERRSAPSLDYFAVKK